MRITSFGCSLTLGTELSDSGLGQTLPTPSQQTWSALIAQSLGADYLCWAMGGSGNLSVMDRVLSRWKDFPEEFFIINWTYIDRFDYSDPAGHHYGAGANDYLTARPGESDAVSDFYFRNLHSEHRDKITGLAYIKTTIDCLIKSHTKFLMTAIDPVLFCQQWHAPEHVRKLQDEISPYIHAFEGRNFLDWSRHRGFAISAKGHPLEEAHAAAAELMLPTIDAILRRA